jgi:hypothetical protein
MSIESATGKRAPLADRKAREYLAAADPVLAKLIDARPDFRPRAWLFHRQTALADDDLRSYARVGGVRYRGCCDQAEFIEALER